MNAVCYWKFYSFGPISSIRYTVKNITQQTVANSKSKVFDKHIKVVLFAIIWETNYPKSIGNAW